MGRISVVFFTSFLWYWPRKKHQKFNERILKYLGIFHTLWPLVWLLRVEYFRNCNNIFLGLWLCKTVNLGANIVEILDLPSYKFSPCVRLRNSSNCGAVSADFGHIPFPKWTRLRSQNNFISLVSFQIFQFLCFDSENKDFDLSVQFRKIKIRHFGGASFSWTRSRARTPPTQSYVLYYYLWFSFKNEIIPHFYPDLSWKTCKTIQTDGSFDRSTDITANTSI